MNSRTTTGYRNSAIWHVKSLALCLGTTVKELRTVAASADRLYRAIPQAKKDGSPRECYDAAPRLKNLQHRINIAIFRKVKFPPYVMGGISDSECPRDYIANAARHSGARTLVNEDIAAFFPSVKKSAVFDIWRNFFGFSPAVAALLTSLTTRNGVLPQGAKTSSYLANLVFWRTEPDFVKKLIERGVRYSRWIDDATISSPAGLSNETLTNVIGDYVGMVKKAGLAVKRKKHRLKRAGKLMEVTGAVVGHDRPSLGGKVKSRARAMVHRCEKLAAVCPTSTETAGALASAASLVGQLGRLHRGLAGKLRHRLAIVKELRSRSGKTNS